MPLSWPDPGLPDELREALSGPATPFELIVEDVRGTPMEVFARRPSSMVEVLRMGAERLGDRPYVVFPGRTVTFGAMTGLVGAAAARLRDDFGVRKGDRVAVASANCLEFVLCFWAATALGAVTVALNGWWVGPELAYGIALSRPAVVFCDRRRLDRLAGEDLGDVRVHSLEDAFGDIGAGAAGTEDLPTVATDEDDMYLVLFTSGTTGRPKGVMVTHRNTVHFGMAAQLRAIELRARAVASGRAVPDPPARPCSIGAAPMFHVSGLNCTLALAPLTGLTIVYPPPGRWREDVHLQLTEEHKVTNWSLVPTQLWRLLDWPDLGRYDLSSLVGVGGGSAVWPPELLGRLEQRLPWVRPGLGVGYGATETNGLGTSLGGADTYARPDSIGRPYPSVQVDVRDPVTRRSLAEGELGEIALRSAANFAGYWDDPAATAAVVDSSGWYHTGDLGYHRDGFVYLAGRRSDLIIRGGENVYPVEVENALVENPLIAEAAVVGVEHPVLGQQVKAYVVPAPGASLTAADVREGCRRSLAAFKVPELVEIVDALAHNATGKVMKHLLGAPGSASAFEEE